MKRFSWVLAVHLFVVVSSAAHETSEGRQCLARLKGLVATERPYAVDVDLELACLLNEPAKLGDVRNAASSHVREGVRISGGRLQAVPPTASSASAAELWQRTLDTQRRTGLPEDSPRLPTSMAQQLHEMLDQLDPNSEVALPESLRERLREVQSAMTKLR